MQVISHEGLFLAFICQFHCVWGLVQWWMDITWALNYIGLVGKTSIVCVCHYASSWSCVVHVTMASCCALVPPVPLRVVKLQSPALGNVVPCVRKSASIREGSWRMGKVSKLTPVHGGKMMALLCCVHTCIVLYVVMMRLWFICCVCCTGWLDCITLMHCVCCTGWLDCNTHVLRVSYRMVRL